MSRPNLSAVTESSRRATLVVAAVAEVLWLLFLVWMVVRGG